MALEFAGSKLGKLPRGYSPGRPAGACIWVVIHTTEGSEVASSAEDGNAYDARRTDDVSTHVFVDQDSVVQELASADRAWAARTVANNRGYHVELCGRAAQTATQWQTGASMSELSLAAQHCARVCIKLGIPPRWCTQADVNARRPGFLTHANVSAWLEGTHTDPGPNFPRTAFINLVAHWVGVYTKPVPVPESTEEFRMRVVNVKGTNAYYKTDGFSYSWVPDVASLNNLVAAFGTAATVPNLAGLGKSADSSTTKLPAGVRYPDTVGLQPDTVADDEGLEGEHG